MNNEQIKGNWNQFAGKVKESWGKLTDDDVALLKGRRDQFYGKLQETYGIAKEEAEKRINELEKSCGYCSSDKAA